MKKLILLAIVLILVVPTTLAYKTEYKGIPVYVYNYKTDMVAWNETFDSVPFQYYGGIRSIRIYKEITNLGIEANGLYYWGIGVMCLTDNSIIDLTHELTHHQDYNDGVSAKETAKHGKRFYDKQEKMLSEVIQ